MDINTAGDLPVGGLDPLIGRTLTGWARRGQGIKLSIDGVEIGSAIAERERHFSWARRIYDAAEFSFSLPDDLRDGDRHTIRVTDESDRDLPGSPIDYRASRVVGGSVDAVSNNVVFGTVTTGADAALDRVTVVARVGNETVALAPAVNDPDEPSGATRRFTLALPTALASSGHRVVHVGVVGSDVYLSGSPAILARSPRSFVRAVSRVRPLRMSIKISAPNVRVAHEWGDYHFARQLGAALQRRGWIVRVDCADEWTKEDEDVVLALRGRHRYVTKPHAINLMWQISHPDRMVDAELTDYDHIFVASNIHAKTLSGQTSTPVSTLHQATDPSVFRPPLERVIGMSKSALFVGNSRKEYRTMVKWCVDANINVAVYGSRWEGIIPENLVYGTHIDNSDLYRWYGSCGILLNDHWDTMRDSGFLSNRLFDGSAAGAFIITDPVRGLSELFGDTIETASDVEELRTKIGYFFDRPKERAERAAAARELVLQGHTFDHRADRIIEVCEGLAPR